MKKIISVIVSCVISLSLFSCGEEDFVSASYKVTLKSENGFIINLDTDEIRYFGGIGDDIVYPASTTKLLTSLAALDVMPPDELITPGD
ncbi:MAG: D-alanyl-D-alanine carboxypeptidase, partial [Eubacteriales bacterium]